MDENHLPPCKLRPYISDERLLKIADECDAQRRQLEACNDALFRTQKQLECYRDRYVNLYESAPVGYVTFDVEGYVQEMNLTGARTLRSHRDLLIGHPFSAWIAEGDRGEFLEHLKRCIHDRRELVSEVCLVTSDRSHRTVQLHSMPVEECDEEVAFCKTAIVDITEQRQAQESLRKTAQTLTLALSAAEIGTWQWDLTADTLCSDERIKTLFGLPTSADVTPDAVRSVIHADDRAAIDEVFARAKAHPGEYESEFRVVWPDGSVHCLYAKGKVAHESGGAVVVRGITMDCTDRKRAEAILRQTAHHLGCSNRELELFASAVSHDLQEPLRTLIGFAQLLQKNYAGQLDGQARSFLQHISDGAQRMQTLIRDLLAYSRATAHGHERVPTDSGKAVREAIANLSISITESAAEIELGTLPTVRADHGQLVQLFQNLIGNAIKFRSEAPPKVYIDARHDENGWTFSVRDNGIGIAPEFRDEVFLIFRRLHTRAQYPGTGVGLALCKKIVDQEGGRIWVESQPGCGATFYFTIPE